MSSTKNKTEIPPRFTLKLIGGNGNAFAIMGAFQREARRNGWTKEQIQKALDDMKSGDYDDLLYTVMKYTDVE